MRNLCLLLILSLSNQIRSSQEEKNSLPTQSPNETISQILSNPGQQKKLNIHPLKAKIQNLKSEICNKNNSKNDSDKKLLPVNKNENENKNYQTNQKNNFKSTQMEKSEEKLVVLKTDNFKENQNKNLMAKPRESIKPNFEQEIDEKIMKNAENLENHESKIHSEEESLVKNFLEFEYDFFQRSFGKCKNLLKRSFYRHKDEKLETDFEIRSNLFLVFRHGKRFPMNYSKFTDKEKELNGALSSFGIKQLYHLGRRFRELYGQERFLNNAHYLISNISRCMKSLSYFLLGIIDDQDSLELEQINIFHVKNKKKKTHKKKKKKRQKHKMKKMQKSITKSAIKEKFNEDGFIGFTDFNIESQFLELISVHQDFESILDFDKRDILKQKNDHVEAIASPQIESLGSERILNLLTSRSMKSEILENKSLQKDSQKIKKKNSKLIWQPKNKKQRKIYKKIEKIIENLKKIGRAHV